MAGAVINVLGNLLTIPRFGVLGAAGATLLAQLSSAYLFDLFHPATRRVFWMKSKSFILFQQYWR